jgi:Spy/CpxP family protein refolding chaperone
MPQLVGTMRRMEGAFAIVLFIVVGVAAVAAVWALATSKGSYEQIGRGGMSIGDEDVPRAQTAAVASAEREAEIRQMLEARNARRAARGEAPEDVDAQLRALTTVDDPELREEIRTLVEATNARRVARGEEPLDVEAEIDRRLRELS